MGTARQQGRLHEALALCGCTTGPVPRGRPARGMSTVHLRTEAGKHTRPARGPALGNFCGQMSGHAVAAGCARLVRLVGAVSDLQVWAARMLADC